MEVAYLAEDNRSEVFYSLEGNMQVAAALAVELVEAAE
jgi:hypothetical protein